VTGRRRAQTDLSSLRGPADGKVWDYIVEEIEVSSGNVLFTWSALDKIPVSDTMYVFPGAKGAGEKTRE
jgi:hypothetical protein